LAREKFGVSPALTTPFGENGGIDVARLSAHIDDLLGRGCNSVTLFGTTGEGPSVGVEERDRVAARIVASGVPASQLIEGVIASSLEEAAEGTGRALRRGSRAVLLAPPFYFRAAPDEAVFAWFEQVFARVGAGLRDVILYHIPGMTGAPLSLALIERVRRAYPGAILGVKDSSAEEAGTMQLVEAHGDTIILVGDESYLGRACAAGASGAISGLANVVPEAIGAVITHGRDDPRVKALVTELVRRPIVPGVKALVAHARRDPEWARPRPPLAALDREAAQALCARLADFAEPRVIA